jgi:hypothetical protein
MRLRDRFRRWYIVKRVAAPDEPMVGRKVEPPCWMIRRPWPLALFADRAQTGEWVQGDRNVILIGFRTPSFPGLAGLCFYLGPWCAGVYWERGP